MAAALSTQEQLLQQLAAVQAQQAVQLNQLERAHDQFLQERDKLRALESELATLTQRLLATSATPPAKAVHLEISPTPAVVNPLLSNTDEITR